MSLNDPETATTVTSAAFKYHINILTKSERHKTLTLPHKHFQNSTVMY